ncbi:MAG: hypothetical protein R3C26_13800 [Calditrichia bacterium]
MVYGVVIDCSFLENTDLQLSIFAPQTGNGFGAFLLFTNLAHFHTFGIGDGNIM